MSRAEGRLNLVTPLLVDAPWEPPIPFTQHDAMPFPLATLPPPLDVMVEAVAESLHVPPDLPACLGLAALSTAAAGICWTSPWPGWEEPTHLWILCALPPGSRKSAALRLMKAPIEAIEYDQRQSRLAAHDAQIADHAIAKGRLDGAIRAASHAKASQRGSTQSEVEFLTAEVRRLEPEPFPKWLAGDATPEAIPPMLVQQKGRLAILSAENEVFDHFAGKYLTKKGQHNLHIYLAAHAGDTIRVERKGHPDLLIQRPALTMGLAIQPVALQGLMATPDYQGLGLLGRWLYSLPMPMQGITRHAIASEVAVAYTQSLRALAHLPRGEANVPPRLLPWTLEAADAVATAYHALQARQSQQESSLTSMADWTSKHIGALVRLTALFHLLLHRADEAPWTIPVAVDTWESVQAMSPYWMSHALAVYQLAGADPVIAGSQVVLDCLRRRQVDTIADRTLFQHLHARFARMRDLRAAIEYLEEHRCVRHGLLEQTWYTQLNPKAQGVETTVKAAEVGPEESEDNDES